MVQHHCKRALLCMTMNQCAVLLHLLGGGLPLLAAMMITCVLQMSPPLVPTKRHAGHSSSQQMALVCAVRVVLWRWAIYTQPITPRVAAVLQGFLCLPQGAFGNVGFDHCPPICHSIHPPRPLFIHLSTLPCIHPSTTIPFFHSSVCLSFQIFTYPYINPSIIPFTLHPSTFLSIHWPRAITTQCWYTHYHNHVPFVPSPVLGVKGR